MIGMYMYVLLLDKNIGRNVIEKVVLLQKGIFVLMEYFVSYGPKFYPELVSC